MSGAGGAELSEHERLFLYQALRSRSPGRTGCWEVLLDESEMIFHDVSAMPRYVWPVCSLKKEEEESKQL